MNNKTLLGALVLVIIVGVGAYFLLSEGSGVPTTSGYAATPKDATYTIDGQLVPLANGTYATSTAPGSASQTTTSYFGNEAVGDLNGDGVPDTALILTQSGGGSGTFYYVVAAIRKGGGYQGTSGVLLGDRIAPQTTQIKNGILIVNYADRNPGESFAVQPSVGKSLYLKLDPASMQFGEVSQNFEGEANPDQMTLAMQTWHWIQTTYSNDATVTPRTQRFTLTFGAKNTFSATTDCNGVAGAYAVQGHAITFSKITSTLMYCAGSQEQDFTKMLGEVQSYLFTSKGELVLELSFDSGSMIFK